MEVLLGLMSAFHAHNWMFRAFSNLLLSCTYSPFPTLTTDGNDTGALETVESDGDMDMDEAGESEEENFHLKILHFWGRVMCQLDIFRSCFWIHIQKSSFVSKNITLSFTQFFTSFIFSCRTSVRAATLTYEHTVCFLFSRILRMI